METTVRNWGNSLGIRIPKVYSEEAGISQGSRVDIVFKEGHLIIEPIKDVDYDLDEMMSRVTEENFHDEVETDVRGQEIW